MFYAAAFVHLVAFIVLSYLAVCTILFVMSISTSFFALTFSYVYVFAFLFLVWFYVGINRGKHITKFTFRYLFSRCYEIHANNLAKGDRYRYLEILKDGFLKAFDEKMPVVDVAHTHIEIDLLDGFPDRFKILTKGINKIAHGYGQARYKTIKNPLKILKMAFRYPYDVYYYKIPPTTANIQYLQRVDLDAIIKNRTSGNDRAS